MHFSLGWHGKIHLILRQAIVTHVYIEIYSPEHINSALSEKYMPRFSPIYVLAMPCIIADSSRLPKLQICQHTINFHSPHHHHAP